MYTPFKMKGKSPMMKALVGKQNNLPAELKAKIQASPTKKIDPKLKKTLKKIYKNTVPPVLRNNVVNPIYDKVKNTLSPKKDSRKNLVADGIREGIKEGKKGLKDEKQKNGKKMMKKMVRKKLKTKEQQEIDRYENDHINKKTGESVFGSNTKNAPTKKRVVGTDADGNKTVSRVNKKGVTRKTKTFKNAPGVTKAGKVEKFRKDGSSKKKVVKGAKTNTVTKTNKKGVSKTKVKNNLKTKVKNTGKALGKAGKAVGKGIKSIPKHLDNLGYSLGASAIAGKAMMSAAFPPVAATAAIGSGMVVANEIGKGVRNQVKKNKANKKARKEAGIDKKGNPITMKKKSPTKNYKKGYYGA